MNVIITPPYWSSLNYCARSFCGYADTRGEYRDIGFVVALDDTFSVLWNNRSGDTLRTLVQIDRDWFTEGFVVAGDTLRIRRPKGAVGPFSVDIWGKIEPSWYHTLEEEDEILEVIASASGEWEEIKYVHLRSMGVKDTIASSPLQYVDEVLYLWND